MDNAFDFDHLPGLTKEQNDALKEELRYRIMQEAIIAKQEQCAAAKEVQQMQLVHLQFGTQRIQVHPFFVAYWSTMEPGCWQDPDFVEEFIRDNEEVRVRCQSRKTTISFAGMNVGALTAGASGLIPSESNVFRRNTSNSGQQTALSTKPAGGLILDAKGAVA